MKIGQEIGKWDSGQGENAKGGRIVTSQRKK